MTAEELLDCAETARKASYCPYSGFAVGAALLAENGQVFLGCNIENAAFSPTLCAERVAVAKAVSEGVTRFAALAVVGRRKGGGGRLLPACGSLPPACPRVCGGYAAGLSARQGRRRAGIYARAAAAAHVFRRQHWKGAEPAMRMVDADPAKSGTAGALTPGGDRVSASSGYAAGQIPDHQAAALADGRVCSAGWTPAETACLTRLHGPSRARRWTSPAIPGLTVDKHSTGGVGDKTHADRGPDWWRRSACRWPR